MDEDTRADAKARLKRVAGQVGGVERMVEGDRYCVDILLQIAAIQGALGEIGRVILANHLETCLAGALESGTAKERKAKVAEVLAVFSRCSLGSGVRSSHRRKGDAVPRSGTR